MRKGCSVQSSLKILLTTENPSIEGIISIEGFSDVDIHYELCVKLLMISLAQGIILLFKKKKTDRNA